MRLLKSLLAFVIALVMVSSAVYADPTVDAAEDETYKEVLLPNTTVVTGYPNQNEFYVVTKSEMPTLLTELNHRREMDELRQVAKKHYESHDAIKLNSDIVLALNNRLGQLSYDYGKPVLNDISFVTQSNKTTPANNTEVRFSHFPHTENMTPNEKQLDSHAFAVRMASLFKQTRFDEGAISSARSSHVANLEPKPKKAKLKVVTTKKVKPKAVKASQSASKSVKRQNHKLKKHRVVAHGKPSTFKTKRYRVIKRAADVRPAPKFRIIEYSDVVATKKKPRALKKKSHQIAAKPEKKKIARVATRASKKEVKQSRAARKPAKKKAVHAKRVKKQKFVVKRLTLSSDNKLVLVDLSRKHQQGPKTSARKRKVVSERAGRYASR